MYKVLLTRKVLGRMERLPLGIQQKLGVLVQDLRDNGPLQPMWPNFSRLGHNKYHCHLCTSGWHAGNTRRALYG
jgi:hypothetical protein